MDLFAPLDLYCERTDEHLLSEPLNLISNLAFIIAGTMLLRIVGTKDASQNASPAKVLAWLTIIVGIGSALFHSFANRWSQLCDIIPIAVLIFAYLGLFSRHIAGLGAMMTTLALLVFAAASLVIAILADPVKSNGGQFYFGTWMTLVCLTFYLGGRRKNRAWKAMFIASMLFLLSITMRTIDLKVCDQWPYGTHLFWHVLNAIVLYLVIYAFILGASPSQDARTREG